MNQEQTNLQKARARFAESYDYRLALMMMRDAQEEGYSVVDMAISRIIAARVLEMEDHPTAIY